MPAAGSYIRASDLSSGTALAIVTLTSGSAVTTSATLADLAGATTTVPVVAGRSYEISFRARGTVSSVANDVIQVAILAAGTQIADTFFITTTATRNPTLLSGIYSCVASANVTFKIQYARNSGTGNCTLAAAATSPMVLLVRDIGPTP